MNYNKLLLLLPILAIVSVALVVYLDSSSNPNPNLVDHTHLFDLSREPDSEDLHRLLEIETIIGGLKDEKLKIAFLGEIIQVNLRYDRFDGAAMAAERIAKITEAPKDWHQAGDYYFAWYDKQTEREWELFYAARAIESYQSAAKYSDDKPFFYSEIAVIYARVTETQTALQFLDESLAINPGYVPALFNKGVILKETGNKKESISYLYRSLELAEGTEYYQAVSDYLKQNPF